MGPDRIPNIVIKKLPTHFKWFFLIILNHCINLCNIPDIWRYSSVIHIKKVNNINGLVENFRPISRMCCESKVLDTFYVKKLEEETEEKRLTSENQFGFRKGSSTTQGL